MKTKISIRLLFIMLLVIAVCGEHPAIATNVYWGDIHAHSAYSLDANNMSGVESGDPIDDFFIYARDYANLDFVAITDHAEHLDPNNFADPNFPNINLDPDYMNYVVNKAQDYDNSEFIPFVGYEWTSSIYGHRTVLFKELDPNHPVFDSNPGPTMHIQDLWFELTSKGYSGLAFTLPHHPAAVNPGNVNWCYHDTNYQPLVEIYSQHGNSESCEDETYNPLTKPDLNSACISGSTVQHALNSGLKLGIYAGTDSHDTRPGSVNDYDLCHTLASYKGGLMAVLAPSLTRNNIWSAIKNRKVYGTSGPRIELRFQINGYDMGSIVDIDFGNSVVIEVDVVPDGGDVNRIEIIKNGSVLATCDRCTSCSYEDTSCDVDSYYYVRVSQYSESSSDPDMAWSSPIWVKCGISNKTPDYSVSINMDQDSGYKINPVLGINKGVLMFSGNCIYDFTDLYKFIGIDSIRTHCDAFDISHIFGKYNYNPTVEHPIVEHRIELYDPDNEAPLGPEEFCEIALQPLEDILQDHNYTLEDAAKTLAKDPNLEDFLKDFDSFQGGMNLVFDVSSLENKMENISMELFGLDPNLIEDNIEIGSGDAWLFWHPTKDAIQDIENNDYYRLNKTNTFKAWTAIIDADIEVFFRIGESWNGPAYIDPLDNSSSDWKEYYSLVSAKIIERLYDITVNNDDHANIGYAEIWNEPDGRFYRGPHYNDESSWAEDFGTLFTKMEDNIDDLGIIDTSNIGGCGYLNLSDSNSKGWHSIRYLNSQDRLPDFLSFHSYTTHHHYNLNCEVPEYLQRTYVIAGNIQKIRDLLADEYGTSALQGRISDPRIVISEWNLALPSETDTYSPNGTGSFHFPANYWGAFVSAALTWFRYPELNIERAHLFSGYEPAKSSPFFAEKNSYWGLGNGGFSFAIRTPAIAMFLHSGLESFDWLPVKIQKSYSSEHIEGFDDVIEAATRPFDGVPECKFPDDFIEDNLVEVTALAAKKGSSINGEYIVIMTNLSDESKIVLFEISGFQPNTAYNSRTLKTNWDSVNEMEHESILIDGYEDSNRIKPDREQINNLFNKDYVETSEWSSWCTDNNGLLSDEIRIGSRSVIRIEIESEGWCTIYYLDGDKDGYGDPMIELCSEVPPEGYVCNAEDCDDTNPQINPETVWYADSDGDGYGNNQVRVTQCQPPDGYIMNAGDCEDTDPTIYPGNAKDTFIKYNGDLEVKANDYSMDTPTGDITVSALLTDSDYHVISDWELNFEIYDIENNFVSSVIIFTDSFGIAKAEIQDIPIGVYKVTITFTGDDCFYNSSDSHTVIAVYDPTGGFITGGGWYMAHDEVTKLYGRANIGFNVNYKHGISTGNFEFHFKDADIKLKDTSIDWVVISESNAYFKGQGKGNSTDGYFFFVIAKDLGKSGIGVDEIDIQIWDGDPANPDSLPVHSSKNVLNGGNIVIHK